MVVLSAPLEPQEAPRDALAFALDALASPTRLELLRRLVQPAFVPDLSREFGLTRQTMQKHLNALVAARLVVARPARRGPLPAMLYATDPAGLTAVAEDVLALAARAAPLVEAYAPAPAAYDLRGPFR